MGCVKKLIAFLGLLALVAVYIVGGFVLFKSDPLGFLIMYGVPGTFLGVAAVFLFILWAVECLLASGRHK